MRRSGGLAVRALFVLCAAAASGNVGAQTASLTTVGTVAGGARGYADGVGTLAKFHTPSDLVLLGDGTVLVADKGNGTSAALLAVCSRTSVTLTAEEHTHRQVPSATSTLKGRSVNGQAARRRRTSTEAATKP